MSDPAVSGPWTCQSYSDGSAAVFDSRTMDLLIGDAKAFSASVVVEQLNRDHAEALFLTQRAERAERTVDAVLRWLAEAYAASTDTNATPGLAVLDAILARSHHD